MGRGEEGFTYQKLSCEHSHLRPKEKICVVSVWEGEIGGEGREVLPTKSYHVNTHTHTHYTTRSGQLVP